MSLQKEIKQCIANIQTAFSANNFEPFINYIRFPNFKNIEQDQKITFDFPFTVFTGGKKENKFFRIDSPLFNTLRFSEPA